MHSWNVGAAPLAVASWVTVTITTAGVLLGVVFTVLGSLLVASKRITELEMTHAQKLQEVFLSNARDYLESVYLPLHLAQARLASAYRLYQLTGGPRGKSASGSSNNAGPEADLADGSDGSHLIHPETGNLATSITEYLSVVDDLMDRAAGAFLSPQLEEELEDLNAFLRASIGAKAVKRRVTFTVRLPGTRVSRVVESTGKVWPANISFLGVGSSVEVSKVLAAPLTSKVFEERLIVATARVRGLIKEVTLGAHARVAP